MKNDDSGPPETPGPARTPRRLGLRQRLVAAFALGTLVLSATFAFLTYELGERYLLRQRERTATGLAMSNARAVRASLIDTSADAADALAVANLSSGGRAILERSGEWYGTSIGAGREAVPVALQETVASGEPARQRTRNGDTTWVVVGTPLPGVDADYFEAFPLTELERTLSTLRTSALGAAAVTTLLAVALGVWASRAVLRPVSAASRAASRIALGDLDTRLERTSDPDLAPLVESFNEMVDAVRRRIEREERFVSDVSHELRSPLTTLSSAAALLATSRDTLSARDRKAVVLLVSEVERFQRLVEELLELGRSDAGVAVVHLEPVHLADLVLHTVTRFTGPSFPVIIDPSVSDEQVVLDKRRIEQVLVNLVENAQTHGKGVAAITLERTDDAARIVVEDNGDGVPLADRERVFERFYRGPAAGRRGATTGAGLGLALVVEHVRLHGGTVVVDRATNGHGARFVVSLPWRSA